MNNLLAARSQMGLTLGFHILFAAIGSAMPFLMATSHWLFLRGGDPVDRLLTQAWSRGVAIFFAVGAVSGTLLSFELGLLWPTFMEHAGPIIGMPFSWEGAAFFLEAIALGIFLYGWDRVPRWVHWSSGVLVGVSGILSGLFVVCANAWMNSPAGFDWVEGQAIHIDPYAAMFNDAALSEGVHMTLAAFTAVGFGVAGVHATMLLRRPHRLHARALRIALVFGAIAALLQPLSGDHSAKGVARRQPVKLAAMEGHFTTERAAPLLLGGLPNAAAGRTDYALRVPGLLSWMAYGDVHAEVMGLNDVPRDLWPPVAVVHLAFELMVAAGTALMAMGAASLWLMWRHPAWLTRRPFLWAVLACAPLGAVAMEAGWTVTEVGRQPFIIQGIMRTRDAVTARPDVVYNLGLYAAIYIFLSVAVGLLLQRQARALQAALPP